MTLIGAPHTPRTKSHFWHSAATFFLPTLDSSLTEEPARTGNDSELLNSPVLPRATHSWSHHKVTCEDIEDEEEDLIAIQGIRWREQQLSPGPVSGALLEEVNDPLMDDETDDENDELTNHSVGVQCTNPYALRIPPTVTEAHKALMDLRNLLRPPWNDGTGYKRLLETMPEGRIRKEGLGLSSCAVPLTRVCAPHFRMKSGGHPTKFS
ncbi:hypothetical protein CY34DRAFT_19876 [Suillus luteus UH-Slu-Lm8-n1]|uniref:Uncharacterized protein n=1 Tax=Suillus luteus UH-Slu-Lm8-n1 TaxID=930992 RepID=A0A0C9ZQD8_9AGAM|nr:hypothetical protein CY34DRAFT_19876 [Suillus luteus UH-Slu-Lm8-n1]